MENHYSTGFLQHNQFPLLVGQGFRFFRAIPFDESMYGITIGRMHQQNFRENNPQNRYSSLFPSKKVSYWASNPRIAKKEMNAHQEPPVKDYLLFEAYDDVGSTIQTQNNAHPLTIIDGRNSELLAKVDSGIQLNKNDKNLLLKIENEHPDCLAFQSTRSKYKDAPIIADNQDICFLFFDGSEKQLSIASVTLYREKDGKHYRNKIRCTINDSDWTPVPEEYGRCFTPIAGSKLDKAYLNSDEYKLRKAAFEMSRKALAQGIRKEMV